MGLRVKREFGACAIGVRVWERESRGEEGFWGLGARRGVWWGWYSGEFSGDFLGLVELIGEMLFCSRFWFLLKIAPVRNAGLI